MTSPTNLADRITAGLHTASSLQLLQVAREATRDGIAQASPRLLNAWAADVRRAAAEMDGEGGAYWASVAAGLESMALEKDTVGVVK